jgi:hypothetical protein
VRVHALILAASLVGGCVPTFPTDLDSPDSSPGPPTEPEDPPDNTTVMIVAASAIAVVGTLVYLGYRHQQQHRR